MPTTPSLDVIFAEHARYVWRCLRYFGLREPDLDDGLQEVFLVVHRRLPTFQGRSSLRTWLYGISWRVAVAHLRRVRHVRETSMAELPEPRHDGATTDLDIRRDLLRALDTLDDDQRAVFVLYEIEQLGMKEVAEIVGCPLTTGYSRLQAAREKLAAQLAEEEAHGG